MKHYHQIVVIAMKHFPPHWTKTKHTQTEHTFDNVDNVEIEDDDMCYVDLYHNKYWGPKENFKYCSD